MGVWYSVPKDYAQMVLESSTTRLRKSTIIFWDYYFKIAGNADAKKLLDEILTLQELEPEPNEPDSVPENLDAPQKNSMRKIFFSAAAFLIDALILGGVWYFFLLEKKRDFST